MDRDVHYTKVGVFVLAALILLTTLILWLGKFLTTEEHDRYVVFMRESVSGLAVDAAVKYRGVNIGNVEKIEINPDNSEEIKLTLKVQKELPIKTDAKATLKTFGLTGLVFVEISGGSKEAKRLVGKKGELPIIPSFPSTLARLDDSITMLADKTAHTLDRIDKLLDDEGIGSVKNVLRNISEMALEIKMQVSALKQIANATEETKQNAAKTLSEVDESVRKASQLIQAVQNKAERGDWDVKPSLDRANTQLFSIARELELTNASIRQAVEELSSDPSAVLFKSTTTKPGPGEIQ